MFRAKTVKKEGAHGGEKKKLRNMRKMYDEACKRVRTPACAIGFRIESVALMLRKRSFRVEKGRLTYTVPEISAAAIRNEEQRLIDELYCDEHIEEDSDTSPPRIGSIIIMPYETDPFHAYRS